MTTSKDVLSRLKQWDFEGGPALIRDAVAEIERLTRACKESAEEEAKWMTAYMRVGTERDRLRAALERSPCFCNSVSGGYMQAPVPKLCDRCEALK